MNSVQMEATGPVRTCDRLRVALGEASYEILIGEDLIAGAAAAEIAPYLKRQRLFVVTDRNVAALHLDPFVASCRDAGIAVETLTIPAGEASKSFAQLETLCRDLLQRRIERNDLLVALGGGVIGDLVGFAAAILLRGLRFVQVPTTLLAQVDSAVGGKTAIDVPEGKNLIGAFHQPALVLADTTALKTLPPRELRAGYAEVVKYGLLGDRPFFEWLDREGKALLKGDMAAAREAVAASCRAKAGVVARDEREAGERQLLNLGHTFGHALETALGYGDRLLHGEGVALGMLLAARLSVEEGLCPADDLARIAAHLAEAGLPTRIGEIEGAGALTAERMLDLMYSDKKVHGGRLTLILLRGIGKAFVTRDIDPQRLLAILHSALSE